MRYRPTDIAGVTIVDIEPRCDHRGFFARSFCATEFAGCGLNSEMVQTSISYNHARGTVRGLHRQMPPHAEAKLVRCTSGAIVDVAVDVRPESRTYGKHVKVRLTAKNHRALFLPPYVAHGFQALLDHTEVLYQVSGEYEPASEEGFRWDEPQFGIEWPLPVTVVSEKDASWPFLPSAGSAAS
jgi:dTDP-4-dehydrorhamnose 3,5-epimerase